MDPFRTVARLSTSAEDVNRLQSLLEQERNRHEETKISLTETSKILKKKEERIDEQDSLLLENQDSMERLQTEFNLEKNKRVHFEGQLKTLKDIKTECVKAEEKVRISKHKLDQMRQQLEEVHGDLFKANERVQSLTNKLSNADGQTEAARTAVREKDITIRDQQSELVAVGQRNNRLQQQLEEDSQSIVELKKEVAQRDQQLASLQEEKRAMQVRWRSAEYTKTQSATILMLAVEKIDKAMAMLGEREKDAARQTPPV